MATDSANYSNWILTRRFAELETQATQTTDKIEWGRMLASSDTIPVENLPNMTDNHMRTLNAKQTVQVSDVYVNQNTVTITGVFDSNHNPSEYLVNTIFLTARYKGVEFLAASCVAKGYPMRMPRSTQEQYTTFTVKAQVILATSNSVSTRIDPTTPATNDRVDREVASLNRAIQNHILEFNQLRTNVENGTAKDRQQDVTLADHERRIAENARNLVREPRVNELIGQAKSELNRSLERVEGKIPTKVGSRNLLTQTKTLANNRFRDFITANQYNGFTIARGKPSSAQAYVDLFSQQTSVIANQDMYIVSFYARASTSTSINCFFYSPNTTTGVETSDGYKGTSSDGMAILRISNEWKRYWVVWKQNGANTTTEKSVIIGRTSNKGIDVEICAPALYEGNLNKEHSYAPEDIDQSFEQLENRTTRKFQEQEQRLTALDGSSGRLKQLEDSVRDTGARLENRIENTKTGGVNLVRNSKINESSNAYGFGKRTVSLVAGKAYWFLARAKKTGGVADKMAKIYLYFPNWSHGVGLDFNSTEYEIKSAKFIPKTTGVHDLQSYWYPTGGDRTGQADIDWYMVVESDLCPTTWSPAPEDTEQVIEQLKPYIEFRDGGVRRDLNDIRDNSNLSWYLKPRELLHNPFVSNTSNAQHWFTVETRLVAENVYSQRFMCLDGTYPPAYRMYNRGTWTAWKGYI